MLVEYAKNPSIGTYLPPSMMEDARESEKPNPAMAMGQGVGAIQKIIPAGDIVKELVCDAVAALSGGGACVAPPKASLRPGGWLRAGGGLRTSNTPGSGSRCPGDGVIPSDVVCSR